MQPTLTFRLRTRVVCPSAAFPHDGKRAVKGASTFGHRKSELPDEEQETNPIYGKQQTEICI